MPSFTLRSCTAGASILALAFSAGIANAQENQEIIVTASKREVAVQDVPAAIGVVSGEEISKYQVGTFTDLSRLDPALQYSSGGIGNSRIIIRGIQSGGAATVATYLDEAVITGQTFEDSVGGSQADIGLRDIARVEVLKGPQGTLFGASAMSGAVRIITNKPDLDDFGGSVKASGSWGSGTNGLYDGEAVINVPLVKDQLGVRVVGWYSEGGGFIDNIFSGRKNINDQKIQGVRGTALWRPTEDFSLTATAIYQDISVDGSQRYMEDLGPYRTNLPTSATYDENLELYSLVGQYDLGFGSITGATSWFKRDVSPFNDTTAFATNFGLPGVYSIAEPAERTIWSSELRFASAFEGPFQIVTGASYQQDDNKFENSIVQTEPNQTAGCSFYSECVDAGLATRVVSARSVSSTFKSWAFFAEGEYELTDTLTLTAGIRYFISKQANKEFTLQGLRFPSPDPTSVQTDPELVLDAQAKSKKPSFNFALSYEPSSDFTVYARAASGFRQGGINNASFAANFGVTIPASFGPDQIWNYELGVKGVTGNGLFRYEAAVFHIDWSDQQVPAVSPDGAFVFTTNAGKSSVDGVEVQGTLKPADGLLLSFGATYTDSHLTQDQPPTQGDANAPGKDGDRLPYVSKWGVTAGAEFERPAFGDWQAYARANMTYKSRAYTFFNADNPFYRAVGNYILADLGFGIRNDRFEVGVNVQNLTNKAAQLSAIVSPNGFQVFTVRPRTIGITAKASF